MDKRTYVPDSDLDQLTKVQRVIKRKNIWKVTQLGRVRDENIKNLNGTSPKRKLLAVGVVITILILLGKYYP